MDLTVSMKDSELYPLSFFSNAFDLIQKVQNDFQALESGQVEQFAAQMKRHQNLIVSIHRQMRNIESIAPPEAATPAATSAPIIPPPETPKAPVFLPEIDDRATVPPSFSLNNIMEKKQLPDLRKAFSLNDRFRYQRELFSGREEIMNKVIEELNGKLSLSESVAYLKESLRWDLAHPTVEDFIKKLEIRFL